MEAEVIDKVVELAKNELIEHNGIKYSVKDLYPLKTPSMEALHVGSLESVRRSLNDENLEEVSKLMVSVESRSRVVVYDKEVDEFNRRDKCLVADITEFLPDLPCGDQMDQEDFIIMLQTKFHRSEHRDKLLKLVSKVSIEDEAAIEDDGYSQKVTAKRGAHLLNKVELPNPIMLNPISSFSEVGTDAQPFVLRVSHRNGAQFALWPSQSRYWEMKTVELIRAWLGDKLPPGTLVI